MDWGEEYFLQNNITWNHTGRFELLGIKFDLNSQDKTLLIFSDKLQSVNEILSAWCCRDFCIYWENYSYQVTGIANSNPNSNSFIKHP